MTETVKFYWHIVVSKLGNFIGLLQKPTKAPLLVDVACQTEDECFLVLTKNGIGNLVTRAARAILMMTVTTDLLKTDGEASVHNNHNTID